MMVLIKAIQVGEGSWCDTTYYEVIGPFESLDAVESYRGHGMVAVTVIPPESRDAEERADEAEDARRRPQPELRMP